MLSRPAPSSFHVRSASVAAIGVRLTRVLLLGAALFESACQNEPEAEPWVEVGVFYGGQVQHLERIEIDRSKPVHLGFRVHFPEDMHAPVAVGYEVVSVGPVGRRITRQGTLSVESGRRTVDQLIDIGDDARLGLWNVRVYDQHRLLADRALFLSDRGE